MQVGRRPPDRRAAGTGWGRRPWVAGTGSTRLRRLGHPVVLVAVAVLAVNDHVLKERFSGWWTGKLSDVAGVAIVAIVAWVVLGRRWGALALTAVGFTALKVAPGVAEAAAPVLGGVTLRDPTDLVALAVLAPVGWWLGTDSAFAAPTGDDRTQPTWRTRRTPSTPARLAAVAAQTMGIVGIIAATTATSCALPPNVSLVMVEGNDLYAQTHDNGSERWVRSPDGGRHWFDVSRPASAPAPGTRPSGSDPPATGDEPALPTRGCAPDGACYRIRHSRAVDRRDPSGAWTEDLRATDGRESAGFLQSCGGRQESRFTSLAVAADGTVLVAAGERGVVVRGTDGTWRPDDSMVRR